MKIKEKLSVSFVFLLCIAPLAFSGCSVVMAATQPGKKDLSVLQKEVQRDQVIAELGQPVASYMEDGDKVEIYQFKQGYNAATKASRALFHGAADFFTLGIWEAVGTPTEIVFHGTDTSVKVIYDQNNVVKSVKSLKGKNIPNQFAPREDSSTKVVRMESVTTEVSKPAVQKTSVVNMHEVVPVQNEILNLKEGNPLTQVVDKKPKVQFAPRKDPSTAEVRVTPVIPAVQPTVS